jgi:hypothetical protein
LDRFLGVELIVEVQGWMGFGAEDKTKFWFGEDTDDEYRQNNSPIRLLFAPSVPKQSINSIKPLSMRVLQTMASPV